MEHFFPFFFSVSLSLAHRPASPALIDTNQKHFHINTQHTLAHPETSPQSDRQPQPDHSLQTRATHCKCYKSFNFFVFKPKPKKKTKTQYLHRAFMNHIKSYTNWPVLRDYPTK